MIWERVGTAVMAAALAAGVLTTSGPGMAADVVDEWTSIKMP